MTWRRITVILVGGGLSAAVLFALVKAVQLAGGLLLLMLVIGSLPEPDYRCSPTSLPNGGMADFTAEIKIHPRVAKNYVCRAMLYEKKRQYDLAIADWTTVTEIKEGDAKVYYFRGLDYGLMEDYDNEIADESKAIEIDPGYSDAHIERGKVYERKGERDKAIADYRAASTFWHPKADAQAALKRIDAAS